MIELTITGSDKKIFVNTDKIAWIVEDERFKPGTKIHMDDNSIVYAEEDIMEVMQKIVNNRFGIGGEQ